jgi:hypothetical protein
MEEGRNSFKTLTAKPIERHPYDDLGIDERTILE